LLQTSLTWDRVGSQKQKVLKFPPFKTRERGERVPDSILLCAGGATEAHLPCSSELCGSLRAVAAFWGVVFVRPSEYLGISFHLGKDAGSCRFLNIQFYKVEIFEALGISIKETLKLSPTFLLLSPLFWFKISPQCVGYNRRIKESLNSLGWK